MFLIDGYNLLHALSPGRATAEARQELVGRIEAYCRSGGYRARVVFDATGALKRREARGPVDLRTVAEGRTADEEILGELARTADRTKYTVVSDDGAIVKEARKRGFEVLPCRDFGRLLVGRPEEPEKSDSASEREVDHWMREFGLGDPPKP